MTDEIQGNINLVSVGSLQKGKSVVIDGAACIVSDVSISRPGKHGHAKVNLTAVGIIDGKKRNIIMPGHDKIPVPIIENKAAQVLSVSGDVANIMDTESYVTFDLTIPEELKGKVVDGCTVMYAIILDVKVLKSVKSE
jgi:translation initiation factor 5A